MERKQLHKDMMQGMSDDTDGPVFHFARPADPQAGGAGDGEGEMLRTGSALEGLVEDGESATGRLAALIADISKNERMADQVLRH